MKVIGIIPARYTATRLPGKVLADIAGKPMIQHVYERATQAETLHKVIVATDDERIMQAVAGFGGEAVMTSTEHQSGTDRAAEVAQGLSCELVVNIQGDEPLIEPAAIDAAVQPFMSDSSLRMSTLATPIETPAEHQEPSVVKVVVGPNGFAMYFSRAPIPFFRLDTDTAWPDNKPRQHPQSGLWPLKHIGLYVYTRPTLLWLASLPQTPLERTEKLEQLRALENGCPIKVVQVDYSPIGVDTPDDLQRVRAIMESEG